MLNDRLLVHIPERDGERRSSGGILIPATAQMPKRLVWAEVVALGQNVRSAEVGDRVLFSPGRSLRGRGRGNDYIMLRERDLHAVAARRIEAAPGCYLAVARAASERREDRPFDDADGFVAGAIAQDVDTDEVLMMAWMNAETLRMTLDRGRMVYWSRSRQEVWRKGDTSGDRQYVREAFYDCDGDTLLFKVEPARSRAPATPGAYLLLPPVRATPAADAMRPSRDEFRDLGRDTHGRPGVDRGAGRPRDTGRRIRQARRRRRRVPARVGGARRALEPLLLRRSGSGRDADAA